MKEFYFILIMIAIAILTGWALYKIFKSASIFFTNCDELENDIRTKDEKDKQIKRLYELKKDSFHARTGERLRELAKMLELKYNVEILKR